MGGKKKKVPTGRRSGRPTGPSKRRKEIMAAKRKEQEHLAKSSASTSRHHPLPDGLEMLFWPKFLLDMYEMIKKEEEEKKAANMRRDEDEERMQEDADNEEEEANKADEETVHQKRDDEEERMAEDDDDKEEEDKVEEEAEEAAEAEEKKEEDEKKKVRIRRIGGGKTSRADPLAWYLKLVYDKLVLEASITGSSKVPLEHLVSLTAADGLGWAPYKPVEKLILKEEVRLEFTLTAVMEEKIEIRARIILGAG